MYNISMSAKKLLVGNWKMNPATPDEAKKIFSSIKRKTLNLKRTKVVICPPSLYLSALNGLTRPKTVDLGVQDLFYESGGAFTGEVNAKMAKNAGALYAIIGHSERRALGETDETVNRKIISTLREELFVIACIGEKERDPNGHYLQFLRDQISSSLYRIPKRFLSKIILAYEPIWAIGKSDREAMKGRDVHETAIFIRKILSDIYGQENAAAIPILYGGSTSPRNVFDIISLGNVDGLLVGRESLDPKSFGEMLKIADNLKK